MGDSSERSQLLFEIKAKIEKFNFYCEHSPTKRKVKLIKTPSKMEDFFKEN